MAATLAVAGELTLSLAVALAITPLGVAVLALLASKPVPSLLASELLPVGAVSVAAVEATPLLATPEVEVAALSTELVLSALLESADSVLGEQDRTLAIANNDGKAETNRIAVSLYSFLGF